MTEPQRRERERRKDDELIAEFPIPSRDRPLVRQEGQCRADIRMRRPLHARQVRKELRRANHRE